MMTRFVIETALVLAVIIGFCFEERIARAERRWLKKVLNHRKMKAQRKAHIDLKMREARYMRNQRERELELLELGLDPRPSLKVIKSEHNTLAVAPESEEVA